MDSHQTDTLFKVARGVYPLCELSEEHCHQLADDATIVPLLPGAAVPAEQDSTSLTYVLEGEVTLANDKGDLESVAAGSPRARLQLFKFHPAGLRAVARRPSVLVHFPQALYRQMLQNERRQHPMHRSDEIVVSCSGATSPESPLYMRIYDACNTDELRLPTLPDVALRIRRAINNPKIGVRDVARMVLADPVLSARLIQVANSAAYRRETAVTTVSQAVVRLGLEASQNLAIGLAVKHLFRTEAPLLKQRMEQLYTHSTDIASLSYVLARGIPGLSQERALLAGLLHDIGLIPILTFADRQSDIDHDAEELELTIHRLRGLTGHLVLSRLGFEPDLISAAEEAEFWNREGDHAPDYADLVIVAQLHSFLGHPDMRHLPHIDTTPSYRRLGLGEFDPRTGLAAIREAHAVTAAIRQMLH